MINTEGEMLKDAIQNNSPFPYCINKNYVYLTTIQQNNL
jgi:hypothetical protein